MKLYINTKEMAFEEENNLITHEIVLKVSDTEFLCYDYKITLPDNNSFIANTLEIEYEKDKEGNNTDKVKNKMFRVREQNTWWSFPLYEIIDGKITSFDYAQYEYFADADRRMALAKKVNKQYNPPAEAKIQRQTLKAILDHLGIVDEKFEKYNKKVERIIEKNPK